MAPKVITQPESNIPTGSEALDDILTGGFARSRVHLIEGRPGSGKTTLALQFLMEARGARRKNALHNLVGKQKRAAVRRLQPRLVARRH
jgi:circadian clock protein KaiC